MMMTICILVGLGLAGCGVIIACLTKKGREDKSVNVPPPLPPRVNAGIPLPIVTQTQTRTSSSISIKALPPRHSAALATANATRRIIGTNTGPRGIKPTQFPCCPFDKQRNVPGDRQVIFWDSGENCYRCSRGHRFKSNGKLI